MSTSTQPSLPTFRSIFLCVLASLFAAFLSLFASFFSAFNLFLSALDTLGNSLSGPRRTRPGWRALRSMSPRSTGSASRQKT